mgnify:CR=1 FL=1
MVGKLEKVDVRRIWLHEAYDFSTWLFDNFEILNEQLNLQINPIEKEKSVGPFNVDILAEDHLGRTVVIENQLNKTDHDHLGKVLTYLSNLDAKVAIWISTDPRPEHVTAVDFLNEVVPTDTQFYLLRLDAFKIGDSEPAPLFTIEAGPSEEKSAGGAVKKEIAEKDQARLRFFEQLLEKANESTKIFTNVSPLGYQNWVNAGAGKAGLMWALVVTKKSARAEFIFCNTDPEMNKKRFDILYGKKEEIEEALQVNLEWNFKENRKQQYVRFKCTSGGLDDEEKWTEIQNEMVEKLCRMEGVFGPFINSL